MKVLVDGRVESTEHCYIVRDGNFGLDESERSWGAQDSMLNYLMRNTAIETADVLVEEAE